MKGDGEGRGRDGAALDARRAASSFAKVQVATASSALEAAVCFWSCSWDDCSRLSICWIRRQLSSSSKMAACGNGWGATGDGVGWLGVAC